LTPHMPLNGQLRFASPQGGHGEPRIRHPTDRSRDRESCTFHMTCWCQAYRQRRHPHLHWVRGLPRKVNSYRRRLLHLAREGTRRTALRSKTHAALTRRRVAPIQHRLSSACDNETRTRRGAKTGTATPRSSGTCAPVIQEAATIVADGFDTRCLPRSPRVGTPHRGQANLSCAARRAHNRRFVGAPCILCRSVESRPVQVPHRFRTRCAAGARRAKSAARASDQQRHRLPRPSPRLHEQSGAIVPRRTRPTSRRHDAGRDRERRDARVDDGVPGRRCEQRPGEHHGLA
jgi:hypothetical protein